MATFTTNLKITKPIDNDSGWGVTLNGNSDLIDGLSPIGSLFVSTAESPSASLNFRVTGGSYQKADGTVGTYAGTSSFTVSASATSNLWITDPGTLTAGASWPTTPHVRLAIVVAGGTTISSVADARIAAGSLGASKRVASQTVATTYVVTNGDSQIRADATAGAFTITLPAANTVAGLVIWIIKIDAVANVTIASASNINGSGSTTLTTQYQAKTFVADGTSNTWNVF